MSFTVPLFYPNPLASEYQKEIGGTYHATEMFNFLGDVDDLTDMSKDTADVQIGWARMSDWLPWMNMQGRDGIIYMHTAGRKMESWDDFASNLLGKTHQIALLMLGTQGTRWLTVEKGKVSLAPPR